MVLVIVLNEDTSSGISARNAANIHVPHVRIFDDATTPRAVFEAEKSIKVRTIHDAILGTKILRMAGVHSLPRVTPP